VLAPPSNAESGANPTAEEVEDDNVKLEP